MARRSLITQHHYSGPGLHQTKKVVGTLLYKSDGDIETESEGPIHTGSPTIVEESDNERTDYEGDTTIGKQHSLLKAIHLKQIRTT